MSDYKEYKVNVWADGDKFWYLNGKQHREDGPAEEWTNGNKFWYLNGKQHREDGPATEYANGSKYWYLNGEEFTEKEFNERMKKTCTTKVITIESVEYKLVPTE